jgi:hypothetical protein
MESKDVVRRTIEEDGKLLVSFRTHDGYFRVPNSAKQLKQRILRAERDQEEISFTFDRDLNILKIY